MKKHRQSRSTARGRKQQASTSEGDAYSDFEEEMFGKQPEEKEVDIFSKKFLRSAERDFQKMLKDLEAARFVPGSVPLNGFPGLPPTPCHPCLGDLE